MTANVQAMAAKMAIWRPCFAVELVMMVEATPAVRDSWRKMANHKGPTVAFPTITVQ